MATESGNQLQIVQPPSASDKAAIDESKATTTSMPGLKITRGLITKVISGASFAHYHFQDVGAKDVTFVNCDFKYCVFERCYFRDATFHHCDFTGARFIDSNLRGATLTTCNLKYTSYKGTVLDAGQFEANLPADWENVRAEVIRSLRVNAHGLGDSETVNHFILLEMNATLEHWKKATFHWFQHGTYYKKYGGSKWLGSLWKLVFYRFDRFAWGHGERPWRILRNIVLIILFSALFLTRANTPGQTH